MSQGNVSRTGKRWVVAGWVLAALVCAGVPRTAAAQSPPGDVAQARELFVRGSELRDQGDVRGALEKFKAAHAIAVNPITTFELARTYEALGMLEEARDAYASIAGLPVGPEETVRATNARRDGAKAAADLKARVPAPAPPPVVLPPVVSSRQTTLAGAASQTAPVASSPQAPPAASAAEPCPRPGSRPQLAMASPADDARPAPEGGGNHFGPVAYVGFGVGATGFVAGTILAAATMSKASAISCSSTSCEQSSEDAARAAKNLGIAATVSYVLGGAGVAIGLSDLLTYRRTPATSASSPSGPSVDAWIGAGAGGVRGSF
jgi:hypothetical protein